MSISQEILLNLLLSNRLVSRVNDYFLLRFSVTLSNVNLSDYPYSDYQIYVIGKMIKKRKEGYSYRKISKFFNDNDIRSVKGKMFTPQLVERTLYKFKRSKERMNDYQRKLTNLRVYCFKNPVL